MASKTAKLASFAKVVADGLRRCDEATSTDAKGRALEDFIEQLFRRVPGIERVKRNTLNAFATEEVDLAVGNVGAPDGLAAFPDVLLVECKNWSEAVGSAEVAYFVSRVRQRGCMCGILIAMSGITGDAASLTAARFEIATALKEKIRILVVRRSELESLMSAAELVTLLKEKTLELVAAGTCI